VANSDADRRLREVEDDLERIDAALRRLDDGSNGSCVACREPLPPAVLTIDPLADRCPSS
jgi:RNA polymerase-binding transcription factor DksA